MVEFRYFIYEDGLTVTANELLTFGISTGVIVVFSVMLIGFALNKLIRVMFGK